MRSDARHPVQAWPPIARFERMGFLDKAKDTFNKNRHNIRKGADKATDVVDDKTKGKHTDTLDKVDDAVDKATRKSI